MEKGNNNLDKIYIRDMKLSCIIGINEDERINQQDIIINIIIYTDLSKACKSDKIEDTVNYKELKKSIVTMTRTSSYYLIERLADHIMELCFKNSRVEKATVRVDKPFALTFARTVSVEITRTRKSME
jgi:FolB domain-containing protein